MSSSSNVLMMEKSRLEAKRESQQSMEAFLAPVPIPCMANRRVKFSERNMEEQLPGSSSKASTVGSLRIDSDRKEYNVKKDKGSKLLSMWFPSCLVTMSFSGKMSRRHVAAIMVVLVLVMVAVLLMGSSR